MEADLSREFDAVQAGARDYLDGMTYADEAKLRRAFHPKCIIFGHYRGRFEDNSLDAFVDEVRGSALPLGTPYTSAIASIDITGDVAVAKVTDIWSNARFTDYLTMVKHKGAWVIVNKAFYVHE